MNSLCSQHAGYELPARSMRAHESHTGPARNDAPPRGAVRPLGPQTSMRSAPARHLRSGGSDEQDELSSSGSGCRLRSPTLATNVSRRGVSDRDRSPDRWRARAVHRARAGGDQQRPRARVQTGSRSPAGARRGPMGGNARTPKRGAALVMIIGPCPGVAPRAAARPRHACSAPAQRPGERAAAAKLTLATSLPLDVDGDCRSNGPRFANAQACTHRSVTPADQVGFKEMDVLNILLKRSPRGRTGGAAGVSLIAQLTSGFGV